MVCLTLLVYVVGMMLTQTQSLMNFILPHHFAESIGSLRTIFKVKGDSKVTMLAQERVSRAKKMMTPFVLRRRKDQVTIILFLHAASELTLSPGLEGSTKKDGAH